MNITPIVEAVFTLIAAIITVVIVPYIRSKTTDTQRAELQALVQIAVTAAEQLYTKSGMGKEKKAYVLNWLSERGLTVDEKKLDAMIESAVYALKTQTQRKDEQYELYEFKTGNIHQHHQDAEK